MKPMFSVPVAPLVPVKGREDGFPVHRIFCVGRNYAAHAAEMGNEVDREEPFYFTKPATALTLSGASIAYSPGTRDLHHEVELVVAIGRPAFRVKVEEADDAVFGFAVGLDMTRRDLQNKAKEKRQPWDLSKAFEQSAIISEIAAAEDVGNIEKLRIWLTVNDALRQEGLISDMVWSVPEIISHLSHFYHLAPGDLIYTGTPSGVGTVVAGDLLHGGIDGVGTIDLVIAEAE
ncbi:fumarylacetoacetate hydrolase family protein [Ciceribacter sp. L1K23]|uniref:fumarylacetoacetate hydrolase family protein n=1 Tax=Ciceribacter sp. L1K23 TaxID=2820276 RepID=UPI001B82F397|nr:fumarylacetoacetate hydrolase family protein [Ciceribacter sp. L1K23]MBR0558152.1 fumarylacetoacetate hydrolase family protein [Ciceribacter sp. L1K23]